ncbi:MAG: phosphoribosyltransferase family protein [Patescibacteria group bacterium]
MRFRDRMDAGQQLAEALEEYRLDDVVVYALPKGGVVLGYYVAKHLKAPLDIIITRKISHPQNPDLAVCAIAEDGHGLCDQDEIAYLNQEWLRDRMEVEQLEAQRQRQTYLKKYKQVPEISGKIAILVDDGNAGDTALLLAIEELRHKNPRQIVAALPVIPEELVTSIWDEVDDLVVLNVPFEFSGVARSYYEEFFPVSDDDVVSLLQQVP